MAAMSLVESVFRGTGIRVLAARPYESDNAGTQLVAIVNRKMASVLAGQDPIGKRLRRACQRPPRRG